MSTTSSKEDPVDAVIDLLINQPDSVWTNEVPTVQHTYDVPFSEKGPGDGQPAEFYVWMPIDTDINKLTAEGRYNVKDHTINIQIWTLYESETMQYARDVVQVFSQYMANQQEFTEFLTLEPTASRDYRSDKFPRQTSHFLAMVELSPKDLVRSKVPESLSTFDFAFDTGFA